MLCYDCENRNLLQSLIAILLSFPGLSGDAPLIKKVPFLPDKFARQVAAAVTIQSVVRGHQKRCSLSCGLRTAVTLRRVVLCIQSVEAEFGLASNVPSRGCTARSEEHTINERFHG